MFQKRIRSGTFRTKQSSREHEEERTTATSGTFPEAQHSNDRGAEAVDSAAGTALNYK